MGLIGWLLQARAGLRSAAMPLGGTVQFQALTSAVVIGLLGTLLILP